MPSCFCRTIISSFFDVLGEENQAIFEYIVTIFHFPFWIFDPNGMRDLDQQQIQAGGIL